MGSLSTIFKLCQSSTVSPVNKTEMNKQPPQETAVFYLLDTLKLSYQAALGQVSIEKLTQQGAMALIQQVENEQTSLSRNFDPAGQHCCFYLQLCAVQWERTEKGVRVRAMPDAASLRFIHSKADNFEGHFLHHYPDQKRDDGITPYLEPVKTGLQHCKTSLPDLAAFFSELSRNNQKAVSVFGKQQLLCADHFSAIFTEHETARITPLVEALTYGSNR